MSSVNVFIKEGIPRLKVNPIAPSVENVNIEDVLPGMLDEIGGEWKQIWTEGSPEDRVRFCSYALTEVASWLIGVGEVKTAAASAKAAAFADEPGRFVKWSKYFNRVDDVRHAGRVVSYTDEVGRFMSAFTDDISRQVSQNVDNAGRYLARIGKGAGNWVDNAGRGVSKMDFGDLRRWLRESLEDANERAQRMFDPELAGPEGWRMKMSEADEMLGGKKPTGPGEVNGGAGVEIKGGVEPEEIAKVVDGPGQITNNFADDSIRHANSGDFTYDPKTGKVSKMKSGGHGQDNIDFLEANGIEYNIEKTYSNGVRVGNVPGHKQKPKRTGSGQSWFPESWDAEKIREAGDYVIEINKGENIADGMAIFGEYDGVRVGVIYTDGVPSTIFPDAVQPQ